MGQTVSIDRDAQSGVATIRLDRPKVNAIDEQVVEELAAAAAELAAADDIRAVVLWGGPRVFAAGADINSFPDLDPDTARSFSNRINDALLAIENLPQISIAAVNGYALGGGMEMSMATDFRVAADDATFGQPEILLGIIPGGGGTQRLPRLVGITRAKEIIYTGRQVSASEALEIGLVSHLHPADHVYDAALDLARRYAAGPAALRMAKRSVMDGLHLRLADAAAREADHFGDCFTTADARTGVASFLESGPGKATFSGR
ncbi:MAG: enoyl-CoA hydratase/isomerase family protein [Acidimicrobiales bacterium]